MRTVSAEDPALQVVSVPTQRSLVPLDAAGVTGLSSTHGIGPVGLYELDRYVAGSPPLSRTVLPPFGARAWERRLAAQPVWKTVVDLVVSVALLVALSPLLLLVALAVRVTSRGPALFRQERIGQNGVPFTIYKFRTMTLGADRQLHELLHQNGRAGQPLFKVDDDPRITPLGKVLRRLSIDELPQLLNVINGQMSLVGPRPQVAAEVHLYTPRQARRLSVLPGMTGAWQVAGRTNVPWSEAVELDLGYVDELSAKADAMILLRTVKAVLAADGAK